MRRADAGLEGFTPAGYLERLGGLWQVVFDWEEAHCDSKWQMELKDPLSLEAMARQAKLGEAV